ncbi:universal stress protein [Streptomyces sp. ZYX-F-203]
MNVVVGVDGSASSLTAVDQAAREARIRRAGLRVVHAAGRRPTEDADRMVGDAARHARSVAPEVEVFEVVVVGSPVEVLETESRTARLVVIGSRGAGGFIGMVLGSTAVSLAAHSRCPVLVARGDPTGSGPVVLGVDGSPVGEPAVDFAFTEASLRGSAMTAVHAWLPEYAPVGSGVESAERLLAESLVGHGQEHPDVQVRREVASGETREVLIDRSREAQLVVVGARGRGGFAGMLLGSVSQALLLHAHCPVVVVRGREGGPG